MALATVAMMVFLFPQLEANSGTELSRADVSYQVTLSFEVNGERREFVSRMQSEISVSERYGERFYSGGRYKQAYAATLDLPGQELLVSTAMPMFSSYPSFGHVLIEACDLEHRRNESPRGWTDRVSRFRGECRLDPGTEPIVLSISDPERPTEAEVVNLRSFDANPIRYLGATIRTVETIEATDVGRRWPEAATGQLHISVDIPEGMSNRTHALIRPSDLFWRVN